MDNVSNTVKISFVVPCFNEEKNVATTLETIREAVESLNLDYEVVVIDDGSSDQTGSAVESYIAKNPRMRVFLHRNEVNSGLGYSYLRGVSLARGEYYMAVHGDHSEPLEALRAILVNLGKADLVIPYVKNPGTRSLSRRLVSRTFVRIVNCITGNNIRYYNGPVLHKRANILKCENPGSGFGFQAELVSQLLMKGCSFVEVGYPANIKGSDTTSAFRMANLVSVAGSLFRLITIRLLKS